MLRDSEKTLRLQSGEIHTRSCRSSKHNCSTQTESYRSGSREEHVFKDTCDSLENGSSSHSHHKTFSHSSQHACSVSTSHSPSEPHPALCYRRPDLSPHPLTITPVLSEGNSSSVDGGQSFPLKAGGGTWPKVIMGTSITEANPLSIFKKPKQRKSIFDVAAFRRPEVNPQLDYLSHVSKHSPQSSVSEPAPAPPTPPARSDSFRFKHRHQSSSASDSTITNGAPPASAAQGTSPQDEGLVGNQLYYVNAPPEKTRKHCEDEGSRRRAGVQEKRRYRPKSAPALRRNVTPLHIPAPMQVTGTQLLCILMNNREECCLAF